MSELVQKLHATSMLRKHKIVHMHPTCLTVMQKMMEVRVQFHATACVLSQNEPSIFVAKEAG